MLDTPVSFVRVKIRLDAIQYRALHSEETAPTTRRTSVRSHDLQNQPFLVFPLGDNRVPVLDLFLHSATVRFDILEILVHTVLIMTAKVYTPRKSQYIYLRAASPTKLPEFVRYSHRVLHR